VKAAGGEGLDFGIGGGSYLALAGHNRCIAHYFAATPAAISGAFVAVGSPAVDVVAGGVFGADGQLIPRSERLFT
jgi:hypothetical protein